MEFWNRPMFGSLAQLVVEMHAIVSGLSCCSWCWLKACVLCVLTFHPCLHPYRRAWTWRRCWATTCGSSSTAQR